MPAGLKVLETKEDQVCANESSMDSIAQSQGQGHQAKTVTKGALRAMFDLPITDAANRLGVGVTVLKKICRKHGIVRWPYRKRKSLRKLIDCVKEYANQGTSNLGECLSVLQELEYGGTTGGPMFCHLPFTCI